MRRFTAHTVGYRGETKWAPASPELEQSGVAGPLHFRVVRGSRHVSQDSDFPPCHRGRGHSLLSLLTLEQKGEQRVAAGSCQRSKVTAESSSGRHCPWAARAGPPGEGTGVSHPSAKNYLVDTLTANPSPAPASDSVQGAGWETCAPSRGCCPASAHEAPVGRGGRTPGIQPLLRWTASGTQSGPHTRLL